MSSISVYPNFFALNNDLSNFWKIVYIAPTIWILKKYRYRIDKHALYWNNFFYFLLYICKGPSLESFYVVITRVRTFVFTEIVLKRHSRNFSTFTNELFCNLRLFLWISPLNCTFFSWYREIKNIHLCEIIFKIIIVKLEKIYWTIYAKCRSKKIKYV